MAGGSSNLLKLFCFFFLFLCTLNKFTSVCTSGLNLVADIGRVLALFKYGPFWASFCSFSSFSHHNSNLNLKSLGTCSAWESNPGPHDSWGRLIRWTSPNATTFCCNFPKYFPLFWLTTLYTKCAFSKSGGHWCNHWCQKHWKENMSQKSWLGFSIFYSFASSYHLS